MRTMRQMQAAAKWDTGFAKPESEPPVSSSELVRRPVVALGYQAPDGTIVVTDVLCTNSPDMTNEEMAALSWKLDQWSREARR